jgi:hypothetical protein
MCRYLTIALLAVATLGCEQLDAPAEASLTKPVAHIETRDFDREVCQQRIARLKTEQSLPGTPAFDQHRAEVLGRAVGEPMVFVTSPPAAVAKRGQRMHHQVFLQRLRKRHRTDKAKLRQQVLRDGYIFAEDPYDAFALVRELTLPDLFDDEEIWLMRGDKTHRLERKSARYHRGKEYRYTSGQKAGRTAKLLFGDRIAEEQNKLTNPRHRDVKSLRNRAGFDRIDVLHSSETLLLAKLRFAGLWVTALIESEGAHLELACIDAPRERRDAINHWVEADEPRRRALAALQHAIGDLVAERLPFDRPRGVEDHLSDGQLRPQWRSAYLRGATSFTHDEKGYLVFDRQGRPNPPQMCVELILDTYERAAGTWYRPRGETRQRVIGRLNFDDYELHNRAGVLAFEKFAISKPELFVARRFPNDQRVRFKDRRAFFAYFMKHADEFKPGDVIAIQGRKGDGYIHQHAILIEDVDPVTGVPHALVDQMRRPRRRSWEGIMAEAPLRSPLYHVRLKPELLLKLDGGAEPRATAGL